MVEPLSWWSHWVGGATELVEPLHSIPPTVEPDLVALSSHWLRLVINLHIDNTQRLRRKKTQAMSHNIVPRQSILCGCCF